MVSTRMDEIEVTAAGMGSVSRRELSKCGAPAIFTMPPWNYQNGSANISAVWGMH
jgi:hypothetical protein